MLVGKPSMLVGGRPSSGSNDLVRVSNLVESIYRGTVRTEATPHLTIGVFDSKNLSQILDSSRELVL